MSSYAGRTALVTGAGSGIGRAIALRLLALGATVVATDIDAARLNHLTVPEGGSANALRTAELDIADADAFRAVVSRNGPIDVLVNNAGIGMAGLVEDVSLEQWRRVLDINTMGVVNGIDAVYASMIARGGGQIINIASGAGLLPRPGMVPYATSKAAVLGLSLSLHAEAAAHGISVSVACPGYIATDIMSATEYQGLDAAGLKAAIPLKPMTAERCARIVLRGAARGRAVIPVSTATWVEWWLSRLSPALVLKIARIRAKTFRSHRVR